MALFYKVGLTIFQAVKAKFPRLFVKKLKKAPLKTKQPNFLIEFCKKNFDPISEHQDKDKYRQEFKERKNSN